MNVKEKFNYAILSTLTEQELFRNYKNVDFS